MSHSDPHPVRYLRILSLRRARPGAIQKGLAALSVPPVPPSQAAGSWAGLRNLSWTSHFSHAAEAGEQSKGPKGHIAEAGGRACCLFVQQQPWVSFAQLSLGCVWGGGRLSFPLCCSGRRWEQAGADARTREPAAQSHSQWPSLVSHRGQPGGRPLNLKGLS